MNFRGTKFADNDATKEKIISLLENSKIVNFIKLGRSSSKSKARRKYKHLKSKEPLKGNDIIFYYNLGNIDRKYGLYCRMNDQKSGVYTTKISEINSMTNKQTSFLKYKEF